MASLVRINMSRFIYNKSSKALLCTSEINKIALRTIISKAARLQNPNAPPKPAPYNYEDKYYGIFKYYIDRTTKRFDENTKLLVVEGPIASCKSAFAKQLAEELDMRYLPEANLDMDYINDYGYDLRKLDDQMPDSCQSFDIKNFLINPRHKLVARFQIQQYAVKFSQYIDALAHLLSTGQGVVLDRCVYSDFVFAEAMAKQGYLSKRALSAYYEVRKNTIEELIKPHLVIYLDNPVAKIQENIKKRNIPYEVCSPALTTEYLTEIERQYKQNYLKEISKHSELLIYDWSEGGETDVIVEDIERIDFDNYDPGEAKMEDWLQDTEEDWCELRARYSDHKNELLSFFNVPLFDVPELVVDAEDADIYHNIWENAPGQEYATGFNAHLGDKGIFFKGYKRDRRTLPVRERQV